MMSLVPDIAAFVPDGLEVEAVVTELLRLHSRVLSGYFPEHATTPEMETLAARANQLLEDTDDTVLQPYMTWNVFMDNLSARAGLAAALNPENDVRRKPALRIDKREWPRYARWRTENEKRERERLAERQAADRAAFARRTQEAREAAVPHMARAAWITGVVRTARQDRPMTTSVSSSAGGFGDHRHELETSRRAQFLALRGKTTREEELIRAIRRTEKVLARARLRRRVAELMQEARRAEAAAEEEMDELTMAVAFMRVQPPPPNRARAAAIEKRRAERAARLREAADALRLAHNELEAAEAQQQHLADEAAFLQDLAQRLPLALSLSAGRVTPGEARTRLAQTRLRLEDVEAHIAAVRARVEELVHAVEERLLPS